MTYRYTDTNPSSVHELVSVDAVHTYHEYIHTVSRIPRIQACIHTGIHAYIQAYIHTYIHTYRHTYIPSCRTHTCSISDRGEGIGARG